MKMRKRKREEERQGGREEDEEERKREEGSKRGESCSDLGRGLPKWSPHAVVGCNICRADQRTMTSTQMAATMCVAPPHVASFPLLPTSSSTPHPKDHSASAHIRAFFFLLGRRRTHQLPGYSHIVRVAVRPEQSCPSIAAGRCQGCIGCLCNRWQTLLCQPLQTQMAEPGKMSMHLHLHCGMQQATLLPLLLVPLLRTCACGTCGPPLTLLLLCSDRWTESKIGSQVHATWVNSDNSGSRCQDVADGRGQMAAAVVAITRQWTMAAAPAQMGGSRYPAVDRQRKEPQQGCRQ